MPYTYLKIFKNTLSYVPSKILVMLSSLIIVPLFSHILEAKEMSVYFIAIQFLNILCTCSSDWITKSVLRYHERYHMKYMLEEFYSSIFALTLIAHFIVIFIYFLFKDAIQLHFGLDTATFILVVTLVIPCGIRQLLYQYLRVKNNSFLYTLSIFLYQLIFILLFLLLVKNVQNATSILVAMNIAIFVIDIYILKKIDFNLSFKISLKKQILIETIHYALPIVLTNISYWLLLHFSKLYFQNSSMFLYTSIIGFSLLLVYNIIQPVGSVFMFAGFPELVSKYEHKQQIMSYWTKLLQLYVMCILPLTLTFCFYFNEITRIFFPKEYFVGAIVLPFIALSAFGHELLKLINSKYHLQNKTHIEMIISLIVVPLSIILNIILINKFSLIGAAIAFTLSESLLLLFNIFVKFKNFEYLNYFKIIKTTFLIVSLGMIIYLGLNHLCNIIDLSHIGEMVLILFKLGLYLFIYYGICFIFKNKILDY